MKQSVGITNGNSMETTQTVELILTKFPKMAQRAFWVPNIINNIVAFSKLCDSGWNVYFNKHGVEIEFEGEIIGQGWREKSKKLWRVPLTSEGGGRITPDTPPKEYDPTSSVVFQVELNPIYECEKKEQLVRYYHARIVSHPKLTLLEAENYNYLRGCPVLDATSIRKYVSV